MDLLEVTAEESVFMTCPMSMSAPTEPRECVGSECMAWIETTDPVGQKAHLCADAMAKDEPTRPDGVPETWLWVAHDGDEPAHWLEPGDEFMSRRTGRCGMVKL